MPTLVLKTNTDLYDKEYVAIYDLVTYDFNRVHFDVNHIIKTTNKSSSVLDIGSGTGHHVHELNTKGIHAMGIDKSLAMVSYAKKYKHKYLHGDALHMTLFHDETFSHITCLYYTFYYIKNKDQLIHNVYKWLVPGGFFFVNLSSTCNYGTSNFVSKEFTYTKRVKNNKVYETIKRDNVIRRNEHTFYMENIPFILQLMDDVGFNLISKENSDFKNFLYIFQKPE